ncbi:HmuY family protein [Salisaeta longa]|uniref:HmuY family protein n=1 Tax=Salisaeta longa TaxID=503170 RepID=UPI0003B34AA5|nr:HmuY family protein [Salisaeta longa]
MLSSTTRLPVGLALALLLLVSACDSSSPVSSEEDVNLSVQTVQDLPADPATQIGPNGRPRGLNQYTFYSLREGDLVLAHDAENRADSASTQWDIALQATTIRINGGSSGPGNGAAYVAEAAFQEVSSVDVSRLAADTDAQLAIPTGSGNGWYNYNANGQNYIRPIPGRTIVVRTADGEGYAKIRILSYYKGNPELPTDREAHPSRYYTFDYVVRTDGEPSFE